MVFAWSMPSHYLNQCWNIVNWTHSNKLQWNFHRNVYIFIQENALANDGKMAAIFLGLNVLKGTAIWPSLRPCSWHYLYFMDCAAYLTHKYMFSSDFSWCGRLCCWTLTHFLSHFLPVENVLSLFLSGALRKSYFVNLHQWDRYFWPGEGDFIFSIHPRVDKNIKWRVAIKW